MQEWVASWLLAVLSPDPSFFEFRGCNFTDLKPAPVLATGSGSGAAPACRYVAGGGNAGRERRAPRQKLDYTGETLGTRRAEQHNHLVIRFAAGIQGGGSGPDFPPGRREVPDAVPSLW
jgi:hypothetical protein